MICGNIAELNTALRSDSVFQFEREIPERLGPWLASVIYMNTVCMDIDVQVLISDGFQITLYE